MQSTTRLLLTLCLGLVGSMTASAQPVITLSPPTQLTTNPSTQLDPAISGDIVVYTDLRNGNEDVYYYDLSSGTETRVTFGSANQRLNDVSGSRIVYTDLSAPGPHIKLYDVSTGRDRVPHRRAQRHEPAHRRGHRRVRAGNFGVCRRHCLRPRLRHRDSCYHHHGGE